MRPDVHVIHYPGKGRATARVPWAVRTNKKIFSRHARKREALLAARPLAFQEGVTLVVHRRNGTIESRASIYDQTRLAERRIKRSRRSVR
jgi:hypothetical protein